MTFATKKEADAHDKMLDIADNLAAFLKASSIKLTEDQNEEISMLLAQERNTVAALLRGATPSTASARKKAAPAKSEPKPRTTKKKPPAATA